MSRATNNPRPAIDSLWLAVFPMIFVVILKLLRSRLLYVDRKRDLPEFFSWDDVNASQKFPELPELVTREYELSYLVLSKVFHDKPSMAWRTLCGKI